MFTAARNEIRPFKNRLLAGYRSYQRLNNNCVAVEESKLLRNEKSCNSKPVVGKKRFIGQLVCKLKTNDRLARYDSLSHKDAQYNQAVDNKGVLVSTVNR